MISTQIPAPPLSVRRRTDSILRPVGFGVIELLVVLAIILIVGWRLTKVHIVSQGESRAQTDAAINVLRQDLESSGPVKLASLSSSFIEVKNRLGTISYQVSGAIPQQEWNRSLDRKAEAFLSQVVSVRFTGFDESGRFLPDEPSAAQLGQTKTLLIDLAVHEPKESAGLVINDKIQGVDLDGDPTNGVARIHSRRVEIQLAR